MSPLRLKGSLSETCENGSWGRWEKQGQCEEGGASHPKQKKRHERRGHRAVTRPSDKWSSVIWALNMKLRGRCGAGSSAACDLQSQGRVGRVKAQPVTELLTLVTSSSSSKALACVCGFIYVLGEGMGLWMDRWWMVGGWVTELA